MKYCRHDYKQYEFKSKIQFLSKTITIYFPNPMSINIILIEYLTYIYDISIDVYWF